MNFDFNDKFSEAELKMLFPEIKPMFLKHLRALCYERMLEQCAITQEIMCETAIILKKLEKDIKSGTPRDKARNKIIEEIRSRIVGDN